jgi:uncharacterized MAPEG superfamily protein
MTMPFYALVAMLLLVILTKIPVAVAMQRSGRKGYDNRTPRQQQAGLTGWGARALAAHQNSFEALAILTPAVVIVQLAGGPALADKAAALAIAHTAARILYPVLYIADIHLLRSAVWGIGFLSALGMALLPVLG